MCTTIFQYQHASKYLYSIKSLSKSLHNYWEIFTTTHHVPPECVIFLHSLSHLIKYKECKCFLHILYITIWSCAMLVDGWRMFCVTFIACDCFTWLRHLKGFLLFACLCNCSLVVKELLLNHHKTHVWRGAEERHPFWFLWMLIERCSQYQFQWHWSPSSPDLKWKWYCLKITRPSFPLNRFWCFCISFC